jgi:hypothetical protein
MCWLLYDLNAVVELKRRMTMEALTQDDRVVDVPVKGSLRTFPQTTRPARLWRMPANRPFSISRFRSRLMGAGRSVRSIYSPALCDGFFNSSLNNHGIFDERLNRTSGQCITPIKEKPDFCRYQIKYSSYRKRRLKLRRMNTVIIGRGLSKNRVTGWGASDGFVKGSFPDGAVKSSRSKRRTPRVLRQRDEVQRKYGVVTFEAKPFGLSGMRRQARPGHGGHTLRRSNRLGCFLKLPLGRAGH